jgi:hypothetical protein
MPPVDFTQSNILPTHMHGSTISMKMHDLSFANDTSQKRFHEMQHSSGNDYNQPIHMLMDSLKSS